ncbi:MAG: methyl-accepting chemotaxis protein [candidate division WOR-3 bacterium]
MMLIKIYSVFRFLVTILFFFALGWYGLTFLKKLPANAINDLTPVEELIRILKDEQIFLEKYRLFGQKVLLDSLAKYLTAAENKTNGVVRKIQPNQEVIDTLAHSIKRQKDIIKNLLEIHREEDLSKSAVAGIGNLRSELANTVALAINIRELTLEKIEGRNDKFRHRLKFYWLLAIGITLGLWLVELILLLLVLKKQQISKPVEMNLPTHSGLSEQLVQEPIRTQAETKQDTRLLQIKFQKIEDTISDLEERISLMAFNALLEAARAGEAGRGFQVIAEEMRRLTDYAMNQKNEIKKLLAEISQSVG